MSEKCTLKNHRTNVYVVCSPVKAADQDVVVEAHAPPVLEAAIPQLPRQAASLQLGHGRQLGHIVALDEQRCNKQRTDR